MSSSGTREWPAWVASLERAGGFGTRNVHESSSRIGNPPARRDRQMARENASQAARFFEKHTKEMVSVLVEHVADLLTSRTSRTRSLITRPSEPEATAAATN